LTDVGASFVQIVAKCSGFRLPLCTTLSRIGANYEASYPQSLTHVLSLVNFVTSKYPLHDPLILRSQIYTVYIVRRVLSPCNCNAVLFIRVGASDLARLASSATATHRCVHPHATLIVEPGTWTLPTLRRSYTSCRPVCASIYMSQYALRSSLARFRV
jgi:hypothetical protein